MQLTNHASPNSMLTGRSACGHTTSLQVRDTNTCSMRLSHVHLKVRDINHSIMFYTSVLACGSLSRQGAMPFSLLAPSIIPSR